jgi:glycosyltransferase involved in cell wall biosynthesis
LRKLVIISHTDHQLDPERGIVGWGPTVNEINHLSSGFDSVEHVACFEEKSPKGGSLPYSDDRIRLRPIPPFGGTTLLGKLSVIASIPRVVSAVRSALKGATHVQLRLPMGIGSYLLPFFMLRRHGAYVFWVKYANDWGQRKPPPGYALQRWMLRRNLAGCKVTINGFWDGQQPHCLSFENPCLFESEIGRGFDLISRKRYVKPFTLAFVGRLEDAKGVSRIIESLRGMKPESLAKVHFMGDGRDIDRYRSQAAFLGDKAEFHGFCGSDRVREVLSSAHFFLLPTTASEGFPKAIAEAACFGAVPVVSNVSSIGHYIKDGESGFIWDPEKVDFETTLRRALETDEGDLGAVARYANSLSALFTFERYTQRLESEIFKD